jgi:2-hydroxy-3-oxopropionate reductase
MPNNESGVRPACVNTADPVRSVGVIGLGVMGHAIATRLHQQLGALAVFDLRRDAANDLVDAGATFHGTAAEAAAHSDVVVLSLNTAPIVEQVVFGGDGVLAGWSSRRDGLIIDMSSIAPEPTRDFAVRVASRGFSWVDAPLSGGAPGALAGRLSLMIGGDDAALPRAEAVLDHLAARVTHVGPSGAGQFVKLINQVLVGIGFSALAEIAAMTRAADLDPHAVLSALTGGRADSTLFQEFFVKFAAADLTPTGNIANMVKDLGTATAAAHSEDITLPLTELVLAQNQELVAQGHGQGDNVNLMRLYGQLE